MIMPNGTACTPLQRGDVLPIRETALAGLSSEPKQW
jgi:hypothetical protein